MSGSPAACTHVAGGEGSVLQVTGGTVTCKLSAAPRSVERVLDVVCGTGIVPGEAARRVGAAGTVVGLDLNPDMLAVARAGCCDRLAEGRCSRTPRQEWPYTHRWSRSCSTRWRDHR